MGDMPMRDIIMRDMRSFDRRNTRVNIGYGLVTLVFLISWSLLLLWGYRHWPVLPFEKRAFWVGLAALYPVPWVHMTIERRVGTVMLCLSCYLALQCGVALLGH
jgi:hypothetical protein